MEIDIEEFKKRLEAEVAMGKSNDEIAAFIHNEIRMTENMKAGLMEEMNKANENFLNDAAGQFDTYTFQLQELEKELKLKNLTLDQQTALNDELMRGKIAKEINELHEIDPEKYPEDGAEELKN